MKRIGTILCIIGVLLLAVAICYTLFRLHWVIGMSIVGLILILVGAVILD